MCVHIAVWIAWKVSRFSPILLTFQLGQCEWLSSAFNVVISFVSCTVMMSGFVVCDSYLSSLSMLLMLLIYSMHFFLSLGQCCMFVCESCLCW